MDSRDRFANMEVAHISLRGLIEAPRFIAGTKHRVATPTAPIHAQPGKPNLERQALHGHPVTVLATEDGMAFARAETMGYVGYIPADALTDWSEPTHRVACRTTLLFAEPDFKSPGPQPVSLGAHVTVTDTTGRYARLADGRYAIASHLAPLATPETDPVAVAERLTGTPYLWGGNSSAGIDCSGLVQIALAACGHACPGDSDQQASRLGETQPENTPYQRGDLLFWKGHVAWVADSQTLLHANAFHMATAYEPIAEAVARIEAQGDGPVTRHARLALHLAR